MSRSLPPRPSLASLRKQSKRLLKDHREGFAEARALVEQHHPVPTLFHSLRDAQLVLAREYGLNNWGELTRTVQLLLGSSPKVAQPSSETQAHRVLDHACLSYTSGDSVDRVNKAHEWLARNTGLVQENGYVAAAAGDIEAMTLHLKNDEDFARKTGGPREWVPLLYLCYSRLSEDVPGRDFAQVVRMLLDHGADPDAFWMWHDTYRFTALTGVMGEGEQGLKHQPPHCRSHQLALLLLDAGANPNDGQGLYNTNFSPSNAWIELLLQYGLNSSHKVNWTLDEPMPILDFLLGSATRSGNLERTRLLLQHGANAGSRNHYNKRTHHENALLGGAREVAALLLQHGAQPTELSIQQQFEAACMEADGESVRKLLAADSQLLENTSLLKKAVSLGKEDSIRLLLELGAEVDGRNEGTTALHQAAWNGNRSLAKLLVEHGARFLHDQQYQSTPIGWASHAGQDEMVTFLLPYTDDVFDLVEYGRLSRLEQDLKMTPALAATCDPSGNSLLHYVRESLSQGPAILELLVQQGANVNLPNQQGMTPLERALEEGEDLVVETLVRLGARPTES